MSSTSTHSSEHSPENRTRHGRLLLPLFFLLSLTGGSVLAAESLLEPVGAQSTATLPVHVTRGQEVRINRRALNAPVMDIDLFGETVTALRDRIDRGRGQTIWTGHLQGNALDTVIVTVRGPSVSGVIYRAGETFRLSLTRDGAVQLLEIDVSALPDDDADALPDGFGEAQAGGGTTMADTGTVQDLLVVYNQAACNSQGSCAGLEADITTAVAELNAAYAASSVDITMNLVGMALTSYTGTGASAALSDLRGTSDGQMDEIHTLRDQLGADVVSFIYDGEGCGIGYLGSSASYAFNVTDEPCLVGNRTMAHEIGHNQGARHDRQTDSTGDTSTGDNFGYRRCSDGSVDDFGSPYFRTIMTYSCSSASRQGIFSNPNRTYLGVPQGVDTTPDPLKAAHNARTLNESAGYVAGFRAATVVEPPMAPSGLACHSVGQCHQLWRQRPAAGHRLPLSGAVAEQRRQFRLVQPGDGNHPGPACFDRRLCSVRSAQQGFRCRYLQRHCECGRQRADHHGVPFGRTQEPAQAVLHSRLDVRRDRRRRWGGGDRRGLGIR
jgi:hypothetical protein